MILVTGATGFLGSKLLQRLHDSHQPVRAVARNLNKVPLSLRFQNVEWVQGDVLDVVSLEEAMLGVDTIYHCAAVVSFESRHHQSMMQVNTTGTANVVNAAIDANVKKLLHVSSIAALGRTNFNEIITEESQWHSTKDNSVYAQSKYLAEREVWRGTQEGLTAVIVNPSVIIGPGDWSRGTGRLFHASRNGLPFYPKGTNGFVFVNDVVECMIRLMNGTCENERYIVSSENLSYKEFFTLTTKAFGVSTPSIPLNRLITKLAWLASTVLHKTIGIAPILYAPKKHVTSTGTIITATKKKKRAIGHHFFPGK